MKPRAKQARRELRSRAERDELIEQYLPLVHHVVGRLTISLAAGIEREDLHASGIMGLIRAAETWDAAKGASFKTFAYTAIRGSILDELRRLDPVTRSTRERIRRLDGVWRSLSAALGRSPTRSELCEELQCTVEELDADLQSMHSANVLSLDDSGEGEASGSLSDMVAQEGQQSPYEVAEQHEAISVVSSAIASLPEQARRAVVLYYHEGLLLKDIGALLGVSESRVSQILSKAIASLRLSLQEPKACSSA